MNTVDQQNFARDLLSRIPRSLQIRKLNSANNIVQLAL